MSIKHIIFNLILLLLSLSSFSQEQESKTAVNVFIDCGGCDQDFLKRNLPHTNVVRDRLFADCHIQFFSQRTGSGGRKYELHFIGLNEYASCTDTVRFSTPNDATSDDLRRTHLKFLKLGLVSFWLKLDLGDELTLTIKEDKAVDSGIKKDKWHNWVFSINSSIYTNGQASYSSFSNNNSLSAERVTEKNRIDFGGWYRYSRNKYLFFNPDTIVYTTQSSNAADFTYTHALGKKFSAGIFTNAGASIYNNYNFYGTVKGAVEYNIYDYSHSNNKQIRLGYKVGPRFNNYRDTTIYNVSSELLWQQTLSANMKFKQEWGSINYAVSYNSFLHNLSLYSLNNWLSFNFRLFKGFSWNLSGSFRLIRDQVNLEKGEASYEDILLKQQQLATGYTYWLSTGIRFTFGSIYNDVVNPRFGY